MIDRVVELSVRQRHVVWTLAVLALLVGIWAVRTTPVDALPDTSDTQVIVITDAAGQAPDVVDDQVTYPLSTALLAVPGADVVRGFSFFGTSMVYVLFEDGVDPYWARARVSETLDAAADRLPDGVRPRLGPDATGVGWVYQYVLLDVGPWSRALRTALDEDGDGVVTDAELPRPQVATVVGRTTTCAVDVGGWQLGCTTSGGSALAVHDAASLRDGLVAGGVSEDRADHALDQLVRGFDRDGDGNLSGPELARAARFEGIDLGTLRTLQDWWVRTDLSAVDGVAEIASVGGFEEQLLVEVDPERLEAFEVTLAEVQRAVAMANVQTGGRVLELAETEFMVRADSYVRTPEDLAATPLRLDADTHTPVRLDQVARVQWAPAPRRGLTDWNGEGDAVSGIVVMQPQSNALEVIEAVTARMDELAMSLPPGVVFETAYDRGPLVRRAIGTLTRTLAEEMAIVGLVIVLFLLRFRSALVPLLTLPLGVLLAFVGMRALGLRADVMSLGGIAIAIGVMVDASVVLVENVHKRAERHPDEEPVDRVIAACREVAPAIFWSLIIVTLAFLPVFALEKAEGRLFRPLAWTKTLSMAAASVLAITLAPALLVPVARGRFRSEADHPITRGLVAAYRPVLAGALRRPWWVLVGALLVSASALWPASRLASEFMPPLDEGDLLYMPTTPPGLSITRARALLQQTDRLIAAHPQVDTVWGKAGRAQTATDPAPLSMFETVIQLTPRETWPDGKTIEDVIRELDDAVRVPGLTDAWTMPIRARLDMLSTGIRTPVGIKLLGDDLDVLASVARDVEAAVAELPGTASVYSERVTGGNYVDVDVDRDAAARWGLTPDDVHRVVRVAVGGAVASRVVDGLARHDVMVRFPRELREDLEALRRIDVATPMGHVVPLGQVATVSVSKGPPMIKREDARRTAWVLVDLDTDDLGGWVDHAKTALAAELDLPPGVTVVWSGQYASLERARSRLAVLVPLTLGLILVLLQVHFGRFAQAAMLLGATLLFAPVGSLWFLWLTGWPLSVAVGVGFIALLGLAAETGVVMMVYLDHAWRDAVADGHADEDGLLAATMSGAVDRVRPKVMTVATTFLGLLPVMVGAGTGGRVMQRIAAPMVGGLISSTVLTLLVVPVAWFLWRRREVHHASSAKVTPGA